MSKEGTTEEERGGDSDRIERPASDDPEVGGAGREAAVGHRPVEGNRDAGRGKVTLVDLLGMPADDIEFDPPRMALKSRPVDWS